MGQKGISDVEARRLTGDAAAELDRRPGGHVGAGLDGDIDDEIAAVGIGGRGFFHVQLKPRRRLPAAYRPCHGGGDALAVGFHGHRLDPVNPRRGILDQQPFHVVDLRARSVLAAGIGGAIRTPVGPEVDVRQYRPGQRVGGLFVPGQYDIQPARVLGHVDVDVLVGAVRRLGAHAAVEPALRAVVREDRGSRRHQPQPVQVVERSGAFGIVVRQPFLAVEVSLRTYGAGHEAGARERWPVPKLRARLQEQRRHARDRRRCHARAAERVVAGQGRLPARRGERHASAHDIGREPPVGRGSVAAEPCDDA